RRPSTSATRRRFARCWHPAPIAASRTNRAGRRFSKRGDSAMRSWRKRFNKTAAPFVAVGLLTTAGGAQTTSPAARDIVKNSRPLTSAEIVVVLTEVRQVLSGKIFRFAYSPAGPGPLVLMGSDGRPRMTRAESGYDFGGGGAFSSSNGQTVRTEQSGH